MIDRNGNLAASGAEFEAAQRTDLDPAPRMADYHAAVAHLAGWARRHSHSSTGRQMWAAMASLAFGGPGNTVDLGTISSSWDDAHLSALLMAMAGRRRHGWPTDIMPDQELHAWLDGARKNVDGAAAAGRGA